MRIFYPTEFISAHKIKCTVEHLEAVQKTVTKTIKGLTNIPSEERLKEQSLFSLEKKKRLNKELIIVLKYMKKCVSDKKYILLFLMSPKQEGDYKQRGELHIIFRKPSWQSKTHNTGTFRDCSNGRFRKNLNIYLLPWVHVKSCPGANGLDEMSS